MRKAFEILRFILVLVLFVPLSILALPLLLVAGAIGGGDQYHQDHYDDYLS